MHRLSVLYADADGLPPGAAPVWRLYLCSAGGRAGGGGGGGGGCVYIQEGRQEANEGLTSLWSLMSKGMPKQQICYISAAAYIIGVVLRTACSVVLSRSGRRDLTSDAPQHNALMHPQASHCLCQRLPSVFYFVERHFPTSC